MNIKITEKARKHIKMKSIDSITIGAYMTKMC
jgi:hypothetical protein